MTKTCIFENCKTRPSYNFKGEKQPIYCNKHKKDGMTDIISKTCIFENCKTQPSYNFKGEKQPIYCNKHKKDGMTDIINKTCIFENCKTQPSYNFKGEKQPIYCNKHKKDGMLNIINKTCISEWCDIIPGKKYKGYCVLCFRNIFPDEPIARNYKSKEKSVCDFITTQFPNFDWIVDKKVTNGCSRRRPDLLLHLGYQIIIVEVDENQHSDYNCSCENKRLMEISQDLCHLPIVFIRFNPDGYKVKNSPSVKSCWGVSKSTGICRIILKKEWEHRLNCLKNQISYWTSEENISEKFIETIHLFFDQ
jgi:hypothetical protein